jgi:hypothetical protein
LEESKWHLTKTRHKANYEQAVASAVPPTSTVKCRLKVVVVDFITETGEETLRLVREQGVEGIFVQADVSNNDLHILKHFVAFHTVVAIPAVSSKRKGLPSASTMAWFMVVIPPSGASDGLKLLPPFAPAPCWWHRS